MTVSGARINPSRRPLVIGSRGSPLALAQSEIVRQALRAAFPDLAEEGAVAIRAIKTSGDRIQDRSLAAIGGKGLFTKEIEEALLAGSIDLAVHSMKDLPTQLPQGLVIAAMPAREDPRDALIAGGKLRSIADLPERAVLGTASLRRQAQALALRPDLAIVPLRGNVGTRLARIARGEAQATLLALAGLKRLGLVETAAAILPIEEMLPAVAQGAIGVECREADVMLRDRLAAIDHAETSRAVASERALLAELEGSCRTPIAAYAQMAAGRVHLRALIARPDGGTLHREEGRAAVADGEALGRDLGRRLKALAGPGFFA